MIKKLMMNSKVVIAWSRELAVVLESESQVATE